MQADGLRDDQVSQVRGFADQRLRNPKDPFDPSNRRISIIVQYLPVANEAGEKSAETVNEASDAKPPAEGTQAEPAEKSEENKNEEKKDGKK